MLPQCLYWANRFLFACEISHLVDIGEGTIFSHSGLGVVVNDNAKIGKNCHILQNVTIGGNGAKIGANAVVLCDVPDGATAVGIPARIIMNK